MMPNRRRPMTQWVRFQANGRTGFGSLDGTTIIEHAGDMFAGARSTGRKFDLATVRLLPPCEPGKIIALWNNFHALAARLNIAEPAEPLYFLKSPSSIAGPGAHVTRPASYDGRIVYEGELGIVVGRTLRNAGEDAAAEAIFGYTCVNDITASDMLHRDPTFAQWARAKSFDGFGPFGPAIATGLDPAGMSVRTILNGTERQNYPVADMIFQPVRLVSLLSHDMTLNPGDLICCGTSVGVGVMKEPTNTVVIAIDGVGELENAFVN